MICEKKIAFSVIFDESSVDLAAAYPAKLSLLNFSPDNPLVKSSNFSALRVNKINTVWS